MEDILQWVCIIFLAWRVLKLHNAVTGLMGVMMIITHTQELLGKIVRSFTETKPK